MLYQPKNNEIIPMTRRYPDLKAKVLRRDSDISRKIISAGDIERNYDRVLEIFLKEHKNLSDYRYWEVLKLVWILCGSTEKLNIFLPLLASSRKQKHYFMTPEEHKRFRELPEKVTVYRAHNENDTGISWTLSHDYALHFQQLYQKEMISTKSVSKSKLFALIERNKEEELLIL